MPDITDMNLISWLGVVWTASVIIVVTFLWQTLRHERKADER